jgi:hypothetical protein
VLAQVVAFSIVKSRKTRTTTYTDKAHGDNIDPYSLSIRSSMRLHIHLRLGVWYGMVWSAISDVTPPLSSEEEEE